MVAAIAIASYELRATKQDGRLNDEKYQLDFGTYHCERMTSSRAIAWMIRVK